MLRRLVPSAYSTVLANRVFRRLILGFAVLYLGDGMSFVAVAWLAIGLAPQATAGLPSCVAKQVTILSIGASQGYYHKNIGLMQARASRIHCEFIAVFIMRPELQTSEERLCYVARSRI